MNARSLKDSANRQVSAMSQKERDEKLENAEKMQNMQNLEVSLQKQIW